MLAALICATLVLVIATNKEEESVSVRSCNLGDEYVCRPIDGHGSGRADSSQRHDHDAASKYALLGKVDPRDPRHAEQSILTALSPTVIRTRKLPEGRQRILITGGAGFIGSHLVDRLMQDGHEVIVMDNFVSGRIENIAHWLYHPNFRLLVHDVTKDIRLLPEVDQIYHLASQPHSNLVSPIATMKTTAMGTMNVMELASKQQGKKARVLLASSSHVYGDPREHPQRESYNVYGYANTIDVPEASNAESKRFAESLVYSYKQAEGLEVRVARIFSTFGPRMSWDCSSAAVSNFIQQALLNEDITIYGDGKQTRSLLYISDLVNGLVALMNNKADYDQPVNLGGPDEYSIKDLADYIVQLSGSKSQFKYLPERDDGVLQRKPDITTAVQQIGWKPEVSIEAGLKITVEFFSHVLFHDKSNIPSSDKDNKEGNAGRKGYDSNSDGKDPLGSTWRPGSQENWIEPLMGDVLEEEQGLS